MVSSLGLIPNFAARPRAFSNIQPFTYEDGLTYHQILGKLERYIQHVLVPFIQEGLDKFADEVIAELQERLDIVVGLVEEAKGYRDEVEEIHGLVVELRDRVIQLAADAQKSADDAAESARIAEEAAEHAVIRSSEFISPRDFGAVGDGETDDTAAWDEFQNATGVKFVHAGRYLVNGEVKRFDQGLMGNGEFLDADGAWDQAIGDHERQTILLHRNEIDANTEPISPVIKTQTAVNFEVDNPPTASFKHVVGAYHEATLDGHYNISTDTNQNFTVSGATGRNRMAGLFGSLAHLAYMEDAYETENPLISSIGATKNGCQFLRFTRKAQHRNGGYMFGQEIYAMNIARELDAVPYQNNDFFSFGGAWTAGLKISGYASGAPLSTAMFTSGGGTAKHGFWNGIVLGGSSFRIDGDSEGVPGTVGLSLATWRAGGGYADIGIKFRRANRHLHFIEGAKIRSSLTRFIHENGPAGIAIEAGGANTNHPYLHFRQNVTGDPDGGSSLTTNGAIDSNPAYTQVRSIDGEVQLAAGQSAIYAATSQRFAPASTSDGVRDLGGANRRWGTVYAASGSINTSDERSKSDIDTIPDAALDAWGDVDYAQYRFVDAVTTKGGEARLHTGVIAQRVVEAFKAHGLDATDYGLLCYDEWDAVPDEVNEYEVEVRPAEYEQVLVRDAEYRDEEQEDGSVIRVEAVPAEYKDGDIITPAVTETHKSVNPGQSAGSLYGIRYEEALSMEAAYQRRRGDRLDAEVAAQAERAERLEERVRRVEETLGALA